MTDFHKLVPNTKQIYSFKEVSNMGLITEGMLFKLFRNGKIEVVKIGNRNNITRQEIIRYLEENTIEKTYES